jgi:hypothetical protein
LVDRAETQVWKKRNSTVDDWQKFAFLSDRLAFIICALISFPVIGYTGFESIVNN